MPTTSAVAATPVHRRYRYSLSVGWFFTDVPLLQRFALARAAGFRAVEMFWPGEPAVHVRDAVAAAGVEVALINMYEGDYAAGDRGFAGDARRRGEWRSALDRALDLATLVGCRRVNVLTGDVPTGDTVEAARECLVDNLRWAGRRAAARDVVLVVEPLTHLTHPRYLCQRTADAIAVLDLVDDPHVALQYDLFHAQSSEGNLIGTLRAHIDRIAHVQVADVPTRSAPGTGEINFAAVFAELVALGYDGFVGLEHGGAGVPDALAWLPGAERDKGW